MARKLIVPAILALLTALLFIYLLFFVRDPGLAHADPAQPPHLFVLGNGNTVGEVIESDKTISAEFELVGRRLAPHKWYVIHTDLFPDGGCSIDDIGHLDDTLVQTDFNGRFTRLTMVMNCDQDNYHISIRGPYLCTGTDCTPFADVAPGELTNSAATHSYSTKLDLDAPQN